MPEWLTHWLTHWLTTLKDRATQLLLKYKSGALVTQLLCLAHLVWPAQLHWVAQAVQEPDKMFFLQWRSNIVLYLKLAWATHSLVIDSGTSSWSSLGSCTAGNLPPYMNFSWWANKARFTLELGFRMAQHSIWSLPVPLGDQPCPVSPIHTHLLKSMFFDGFTIQLGVTGKTAF